MPLADFNALRVDGELPDERYLFLSDILPTAWQGVQYANLPERGVLGVVGLGPVGQFASRIGVHLGHRVVAVDPVPERRAMAERHGVDTFDLSDDIADWLREATDGRGPDAMVDAVGIEAHGNPATALTQSAVGLLTPIPRTTLRPSSLSSSFRPSAATPSLSSPPGRCDGV